MRRGRLRRYGEQVALPSATRGSAESEQTTSPSDAITHQDLGIRIEVVPRVHEDKEITLKLAIEMSSLSPEESPESRTARGSVVARRTIETTMMVEEGDTQVLTGLVPLKGGGTDPSPTKTEMVLLVTTHVSRVPDVRPNERLAVWRGYAVD